MEKGLGGCKLLLILCYNLFIFSLNIQIIRVMCCESTRWLIRLFIQVFFHVMYYVFFTLPTVPSFQTHLFNLLFMDLLFSLLSLSLSPFLLLTHTSFMHHSPYECNSILSDPADLNTEWANKSMRRWSTFLEPLSCVSTIERKMLM